MILPWIGAFSHALTIFERAMVPDVGIASIRLSWFLPDVTQNLQAMVCEVMRLFLDNHRPSTNCALLRSMLALVSRSALSLRCRYWNYQVGHKTLRSVLVRLSAIRLSDFLSMVSSSSGSFSEWLIATNVVLSALVFTHNHIALNLDFQLFKQWCHDLIRYKSSGFWIANLSGSGFLRSTKQPEESLHEKRCLELLWALSRICVAFCLSELQYGSCGCPRLLDNELGYIRVCRTIIHRINRGLCAVAV